MTAALDPRMVLRVPDRGVAADVLDDEVVIVNLMTGHYFSTDGTGCEVWKLLTSGVSVGDTIETLRSRYTSNIDGIDAYVEKFVDRVLSLGLMELEDGVEGSQPSSLATAPAGQSEEGRPFVPAEFLSFDDMESLLLLDPVHEVDEMGWPHASTGL